MKHSYLIIPVITLFIFSCEDQPKKEKIADEILADSSIQNPVPQNNPVVVQIGAFKKGKNAELRASLVSGASVEEEGDLKKVFVTVQTEDEVSQIKQQLYGQDQPFRRLDK